MINLAQGILLIMLEANTYCTLIIVEVCKYHIHVHCAVFNTNLQSFILTPVNLVNHFLISVHLQNKNATF